MFDIGSGLIGALPTLGSPIVLGWNAGRTIGVALIKIGEPIRMSSPHRAARATNRYSSPGFVRLHQKIVRYETNRPLVGNAFCPVLAAKVHPLASRVVREGWKLCRSEADLGCFHRRESSISAMCAAQGLG
jgi:hypothetical protein